KIVGSASSDQIVLIDTVAAHADRTDKRRAAIQRYTARKDLDAVTYLRYRGTRAAGCHDAARQPFSALTAPWPRSAARCCQRQLDKIQLQAVVERTPIRQ